MTVNTKKAPKAPCKTWIIIVSAVIVVSLLVCVSCAYLLSPRHALAAYIKDVQDNAVSNAERFPHTMTLFYDDFSYKITGCDVYEEFAFVQVQIECPDLYAMIKSGLSDLLKKTAASRVDLDYMYEFEQIMAQKFDDGYVPTISEAFEVKLSKNGAEWYVDEEWNANFTSALLGYSDDLTGIIG